MTTAHKSVEMFPLHRVPITRPFIWLERAWDDILHMPAASLAYGCLVSFMGPLITAGVCELSRRRDHGEDTSFQLSLTGLAVARHNLSRFAGSLLVLALAWFSLAALALYMMTGTVAPEIQATVWGNVASQLSSDQLMAYSLAFLTLSCIVFAVSVVTVPMIVDRHVDAGTAIRTSLRATARDWPALLLWAVLVVGLVLLGFATWLLGLVVIMPLLGHATWHAYRDIVEEA